MTPLKQDFEVAPYNLYFNEAKNLIPGQVLDVDDYVPPRNYYEEEFTSDHADFMEKYFEKP